MYAVLISGKQTEEITLQVIVAHFDSRNFFYARETNGGRGESNSWSQYTADELTRKYSLDASILGEVLATPLTVTDHSAFDNTKVPMVLIQKLTKQYRLRPVELDSTKTVASVLDEVLKTIELDPNLLSQYRSDNRGGKKPTKGNAVMPTITQPIPQPVIKIVHDNYKTNSLSFVPSVSSPELSNYVVRTFADNKTETDIFDFALANQQNVAIVGEAGTGKTTSTMYYAGLRGLRYYRVNFNAGVESSQLFGKLMPTEEGNLIWQDGGFTECWRNGHAVIHLDELSFIVAKQSGVLFPCLDSTRTLTLLDNKGEVIPAGDNLLIVGSYNEGYKGNNKMNEAFIDRFHHKLVFEYDINIEKKFIPSTTLLNLAQQMRADSIAGIYETPISTRLLKNFVKFAKEIGYNYACDNFLNSFTVDERASVKLLLEAHRHNLEEELFA